MDLEVELEVLAAALVPVAPEVDLEVLVTALVPVVPEVASLLVFLVLLVELILLPRRRRMAVLISMSIAVLPTPSEDY